MKQTSPLIIVAAVGALLSGGCGTSSDNAKKRSAATRAATDFSAHAAGAARGPGTVQIELTRAGAKPAAARAKVGQVVVWTNTSPVTRTIKASTGVRFRSPPLRRGGTYTFRVTTAGTIKYTSSARPADRESLTVIP